MNTDEGGKSCLWHGQSRISKSETISNHRKENVQNKKGTTDPPSVGTGYADLHGLLRRDKGTVRKDSIGEAQRDREN